MRWKSITVIVVGVTAWLSAAGGGFAKEAKPASAEMTKANADFACRLFVETAKRHLVENILVSPYSAQTALMMAYAGADGETRAEMARVLGMDGMEDAQALADAAAMRKALQRGDNTVALDVANSMWIRQGIEVKAEFAGTIQEAFDAEAQTRPFDETLAPAVNGWVNQRTHGKIGEILDRCDENSRFYLINAVYFKGAWLTPFNKAMTSDQPFTLADGTTVNVPIMLHEELTCQAIEHEEFTAVKLPFGRNPAKGVCFSPVNLMIFLLAEGRTLEQWLGGVTPEAWAEWMKAWHEEREARIGLPRFSLAFGDTLNDALIAMGMPAAFSEGADFSRMSDEPLLISRVLHKTMLEVDEEGATGAAATAVEEWKMKDGFGLYANRPFAVALVDESTGAVLFMGVVRNPALK